jgi:hypothetical protein
MSACNEERVLRVQHRSDRRFTGPALRRLSPRFPNAQAAIIGPKRATGKPRLPTGLCRSIRAAT